MKNELAVMDHTGDTKLIWDSDNKDEVDNARESFNRLKKKGYFAYAVKVKMETRANNSRSSIPKPSGSSWP